MWNRRIALSVLALASSATGQTDQVYSISKPAGVGPDWGGYMQSVHDLDGDGIAELAIGTVSHGGGAIGTLHSGADGTQLFSLHVPIEPVFVGRRILAIGDVNADGVSDLVSLGGRSGDSNSPNGRIYIFSGADGVLLNTFVPPAGLVIGTGFLSLGDVDGDGADDILVSGYLQNTVNGWRWVMFSTATGSVLYSAARPGEDQSNFQHFPAQLSDHDGDGIDEFGLPAVSGGVLQCELRSGATGLVLSQFALPQVPLLTGNGEPFVGVSDADGDGLRDLAIGGTFQGFTAVHSTQDGAALQRWDCSTQAIPCFGTRLIDVGDLNWNGSADLVTIELNFGSPVPMRIFGLDPMTGEQIFEELEPSFVSAYSNVARIAAMPGLDPENFPTFAVHDELADTVSIRRFAQEIGKAVCAGDAQAPALIASGSLSAQDDQCVFQLDRAPSASPFILLEGYPSSAYPMSNISLCVGHPVTRLAVGTSDGMGSWSGAVNVAHIGSIGRTYAFQALFPGATAGRLQASNTIQLRLVN